MNDLEIQIYAQQHVQRYLEATNPNMQTNLLEVPESLSPRLVWMEANHLTTMQASNKRWHCWNTGQTVWKSEALTEIDALVEWAKQAGVQTWSETPWNQKL